MLISCIRPNREKITAQEVGRTRFTARLTHVQYGTYEGQAAVLLRFGFEFGFKNDGLKRLTFASVRITLEETADKDLHEPTPRNPKNDPKVVLITPSQVCGEATSENRSRGWGLSVPVQYQSFGLKLGPELEYNDDWEFTKDYRLWITGLRTSDDRHDMDNCALWEMKENERQKSGILHRFPAALVAVLPNAPAHPVKVTGLVDCSIAFSVNPYRLRQKRDDPVYLDRLTPKGTPVAPDIDFSSPKFPWTDVVKVPTEYRTSEQ